MAWKDEPRNLRAYKIIDPPDRQNPNSLRRLLFDVIWHHFGRSTKSASEHLSTLLKGVKERRAFRTRATGLTQNSLYEVTRDGQPISFSQLDAMAQHLQIPLGLMLLFTRVRSEVERVENHRTDEARRILRAVQEALLPLEQLLRDQDGKIVDAYEVLTHDVLLEVRDRYLEVYNETLIP